MPENLFNDSDDHQRSGKTKAEYIDSGNLQGRVFDIGGGGEGVIAQVGHSRVIAVDKFMSDIHEAGGKAPNTPWMVADAYSPQMF